MGPGGGGGGSNTSSAAGSGNTPPVPTPQGNQRWNMDLLVGSPWLSRDMEEVQEQVVKEKQDSFQGAGGAGVLTSINITSYQELVVVEVDHLSKIWKCHHPTGGGGDGPNPGGVVELQLPTGLGGNMVEVAVVVDLQVELVDLVL